MAIRVILADDHQVVREGLHALLEREGFEVAGEAADGREAVALAERTRPDVAVLDLAMPLLNGIDAAREIVRASQWTRTVLLTMHSDARYAQEALRVGVKGFVLKTQAAREVAEAIRKVHSGAVYLSPAASDMLVEASVSKRSLGDDPLSRRERSVLQLVAEGKTNKEIAGILGIAVKTAECHRLHIMQKLDLHETAGLVRYAIRMGVVQP